MQKLLVAFVTLWIALVGPVLAQEARAPVVVELFTSQGCSSCPPADAILHKLATRDDVIALSVHVDYWDYIGWKDPFADPKHSLRQRAYAQVSGRRSVYTPQMIIGGVDSVVGANARDIADVIARQSQRTPDVVVSVTPTGNKVQIAAKARKAARYEILIAEFTPRKTIKIKRGENAGRTLSYANVVSDLRKVAEWDGRGPFAIKVPASGPMAVLIQHKGYGRIVGAAKLN